MPKVCLMRRWGVQSIGHRGRRFEGGRCRSFEWQVHGRYQPAALVCAADARVRHQQGNRRWLRLPRERHAAHGLLL